MNKAQLKEYLDAYVGLYNNPSFIEHDPIFVPHQFKNPLDIEIMGFFVSLFAWGNRKSIIASGMRLAHLFEHRPHHFITEHSATELKSFEKFVHRTFNSTDLLFFIEAFRQHYKHQTSLETLFFPSSIIDVENPVYEGLVHFNAILSSQSYFPHRTQKHIASPLKRSSCKRLNMFFRWMVRQDDMGVDFGIWRSISPSKLKCPLDVHVHRVALNLGLIQSQKANWLAVIELSDKLCDFDPLDPIRYDFALFGLGINKQI